MGHHLNPGEAENAEEIHCLTDKITTGSTNQILTTYPLVIQHSHGKWPIYRWFTY